MIDKNSQKILAYINVQCETGAYKVITNEDLIALFNDKKYKLSVNEISDIIDGLQTKKLIMVKYKDDSSFLLTTTSSGENFSFSEEPQKFKITGKLVVLFTTAAILLGFIGGIAAGLIIKFIG